MNTLFSADAAIKETFLHDLRQAWTVEMLASNLVTTHIDNNFLTFGKYE